MRTAIDGSGRIVVPKALRDSLGLVAGQPLEIEARGGRLEVEPVSTSMRLRQSGRGVVAVPDVELPKLTADQVRDTLDQVRR